MSGPATAVVHEIAAPATSWDPYTEIIISNVVPIVFLPQYARFENRAADAWCDAA